jgi:L-threonylcarbamoyladenylate synthase
MIGTDVSKASKLLAQGELVAIPTETVYGLAANALDPAAITKIYEVKNRPTFNPLIVHIASINEVPKYVCEFPDEAKQLAESFWPGSLSILMPKSDLVPDLVTAGSSKVVLRVPNHSLTLELLASLDFPLAAPSANVSNTVSPTTAQHVESSLGNKIGYILDGGLCTVGIESTIVKINEGKVVILREGGISREEIERKTGLRVSEAERGTSITPGQLTRHYSTKKPLYIVENIERYLVQHPKLRASVLLYKSNQLDAEIHLLSKRYDFTEIANNLFKAMREADQTSSECILVEPIREVGLGRAIADRLKRAASLTP